MATSSESQCVHFSPLVSARKTIAPLGHLRAGHIVGECSEWLRRDCRVARVFNESRLGNRCSIRLSYGAVTQEDNATRWAGKSRKAADEKTAAPRPRRPLLTHGNGPRRARSSGRPSCASGMRFVPLYLAASVRLLAACSIRCATSRGCTVCRACV